MITTIVAPVQGHPKKYYFLGTPQAGAAALLLRNRRSEHNPTAPAFAGATR